MKSVLIVMPTIGEVLQSYQLSRELNNLFHGNAIYAAVGDNDASAAANRIAGIEKVLVYDSDIKEDAEDLLSNADPLVIFFIENCYYPLLLIEAGKRNIITLLVSAAMNNAILHHPRYERCFTMDAYRMFSYVGVKSPGYRKDFVALGVEEEKIFVSGDLKMDMQRLSLTNTEEKEYRKKLGLQTMKVFIAGSISSDEIKPVMDTCKRLLTEKDNVKCIVAPRFLGDIKHLTEYADVLSVRTATKTALIDGLVERDRVDVILLDTYGELGKLYGLADAVFVGGTLMPFADKPLGQNILEPLFHGKPVVVGPNVKKDSDIIDRLKEFWPGVSIGNSEGLSESISFMLSNKAFKEDYAVVVRDLVKFGNNFEALTGKLSEIYDMIIRSERTC